MPGPTEKHIYETRMRALRLAMQAERTEAYLVAHLPNLFYLCGFSGSAGLLLVEPDSATLFTDGRYRVQAAEEVRGARVRIAKKSLSAAAGMQICRRRIFRLAFSPSQVSVAQKAQMNRHAGRRLRWVERENLVEELRAVKSPEEICTMREAARVASEALEEVLGMVRPGVRERELAAELDSRIRRKGASGPAFETIVASGARSALPHARPTEKTLRKNELVVFDLGAILRGYCSDLTRTVYLGRAPGRIRRYYRGVFEAQKAAQEALAPGATAGSVDRAARGTLNRHKLGRYFVHSTGHGLGLEVHEIPRLGRGEKARIGLGYVVTLEPGVYFEGLGGIRIEDDIAVLPQGTEVLTSAPRELLEL